MATWPRLTEKFTIRVERYDFFFCFSLLLLQGGGSTLIPDRRKVALHDHKGLHRMLILLNVEKMRLLVYEWGSDEKENK